MFRGLILSFAIFAVSFVVPVMWKTQLAQWVSIGLNLTAVVFMGVWFLAVRRGFRLGKRMSRSDRRAKMHAEEEREKRKRMMR